MTALFGLMVLVGVAGIIWEVRSLRRNPSTGTRVAKMTRGRIAILGGVLILAGAAGLLSEAAAGDTKPGQTLWPITNDCNSALEVSVSSDSDVTTEYVIPPNGMGFVPLTDGDRVAIRQSGVSSAFVMAGVPGSVLAEWTVFGENCSQLEVPIAP